MSLYKSVGPLTFNNYLLQWTHQQKQKRPLGALKTLKRDGKMGKITSWIAEISQLYLPILNCYAVTITDHFAKYFDE